jgi:excisionase family DNA binding protein
VSPSRARGFVSGWITTDEAARILGYSGTGPVGRLIRAGQLHGVKSGRLSWVVKETDVQALAAARRTAGR